ncbi:WD40 repeat domain-containing protein [Frankia nepalensis]|uniref:WD40 repeat domain-containing protein n=1 Tax=Frankia nepalensis TaxID=1836974 RepID=UPI001934AC73|nr:WD40 repeat domain-containing protein [Frankia nepalensis]
MAVAGYQQKLEAARAARLRRVVVPASSYERSDFPASPVRVVPAATVSQAVQRARRRPNPAFVALMLVLATLLAGTGVAVSLGERAVEREQRDQAIGRLVTAADTSRQNDSPDLSSAMRLSTSSYGTFHDAKSRSSLASILSSTRYKGALTGHTSFLNAVAISSDGRVLASGGFDDVVLLWDLGRKPPTQVGRYPLDKPDYIEKVDFATGRPLLAVGTSEDVFLVDVSRADKPTTVAHIAGRGVLDFSPDGQTLLVGNTLWNVIDADDPRPVGYLIGGPVESADDVSDVAFAPDGRTVAAASIDSIRFWDVTDAAAPVMRGKALTDIPGQVRALAFAPDGGTLAVAAKNVLRWSLPESGEPRRLEPDLVIPEASPKSVAYSPDGQVLAAAGGNSSTYVPISEGNNSVYLWDVMDEAEPRQLSMPLAGHGGEIKAIAFSPDGKTVASASYDKSIVLWDLSGAGLPVRVGSIPPGGGVLSADGRLLATTADGDKVVVWDIADPAKPRALDVLVGANEIFEFSPDGRSLVTRAAENSTAIIWVLDDRSSSRGAMGLSIPVSGIRSADFSADGDLLAIGGDGVTVWDVSDPRMTPFLIARMPSDGKDENESMLVAFSGHGEKLVTAHPDGRVEIWEGADFGQLTGTIRVATSGALTSLSFSPETNTLAMAGLPMGGGGEVFLVDIRRPGEPYQRTVIRTSFVVGDVAISPSGEYVVASGDDGTTGLWTLADQDVARELVQLPELGGGIFLSRDGLTMAVGGTLWDMAELDRLLRDPLPYACGRGGGGLGASLWDRYASPIRYREVCEA